MNDKTPTPITDAYIGSGQEDCMTEGEIAMCEFARKLERQLAAVTEQRDRLAEFASLTAKSWAYGKWKAETYNEREAERILTELGYWPVIVQQIEERAALASVKETTICGMKVVVDTSIPQNTAILFDSKTGETLATLKGVDE